MHPLYHNEAVGYSAWPDHQLKLTEGIVRMILSRQSLS
jgi:hypothetical protein